MYYIETFYITKKLWYEVISRFNVLSDSEGNEQRKQIWQSLKFYQSYEKKKKKKQKAMCNKPNGLTGMSLQCVGVIAWLAVGMGMAGWKEGWLKENSYTLFLRG